MNELIQLKKQPNAYILLGKFGDHTSTQLVGFGNETKREDGHWIRTPTFKERDE